MTRQIKATYHEWVPKKCRYCDNLFIPTRLWQLFCKPHCRDRWHNDERILKESRRNVVPLKRERE